METVYWHITTDYLFDIFDQVTFLLKSHFSVYIHKMEFSMNRYLPDSPRWMLRQGRIEEARQILIEGGTKNKRRVPLNLESLLETEYNSG